MSGPEKIWLDPECYSDADYVIDRCWHGEKPEACCDCGMEPVEYIRADHTPDPAQIRADAIMEAAVVAYQFEGNNKLRCAILALIATPLSPTAVDNSPAPDERREVETAARLVGMNLAQYLRWAAIKAARE